MNRILYELLNILYAVSLTVIFTVNIKGDLVTLLEYVCVLTLSTKAQSWVMLVTYIYKPDK